MFLPPLSSIIRTYKCGFISGLSILFCWFMCLFLWKAVLLKKRISPKWVGKIYPWLLILFSRGLSEPFRLVVKSLRARGWQFVLFCPLGVGKTAVFFLSVVRLCITLAGCIKLNGENTAVPVCSSHRRSWGNSAFAKEIINPNRALYFHLDHRTREQNEILVAQLRPKTSCCEEEISLLDFLSFLIPIPPNNKREFQSLL